MVGGEAGIPVIVGIAAGVAFILVFAMTFTSTEPLTDPTKRLSPINIRIPEGASLANSNLTFQPQFARTLVGSDFVRWENDDTVPATIEADDQSDPAFYEATKGSVIILPGEAFEFTFTRAGEYGYRGAPWQQGTIIVLED